MHLRKKKFLGFLKEKLNEFVKQNKERGFILLEQRKHRQGRDITDS